MTRRNLLVDAAVKSRNKPPGYYLDGHGLYLQVAIGGSRSWILRYTLRKKTREMGLGSTDDFGLAEARLRAQRARQLIAEGIDPIDHRNKQSEVSESLRMAAEIATERAKTFKECAIEFHEANADEWKNIKHGDQWKNTLRDYAFPTFGDVPMSEVTKAQIVKALSPIWKTKAETASRVLQRIRTVFNYAAAKDYTKGMDAEFWQQTRMSLGSNERARKVEHHSSCPYPLVGALLAAVRDGPSSESVRLAFEFTILTAARSGETRGALWSEIDKVSRSWTIPGERMKAGKSHKVPLSVQAFAVVERAASLRESGAQKIESDLVFPNRTGSRSAIWCFSSSLEIWSSRTPCTGLGRAFALGLLRLLNIRTRCLSSRLRTALGMKQCARICEAAWSRSGAISWKIGRLISSNQIKASPR